MSNQLKPLEEAGQAVWLDFVDRKFLAEGGLKKLVDEDGLTGVTSNPSIFEKAIGHSDAYDDQIKSFLGEKDASVVDTYEALAIKDIEDASDTLRPVYDRLSAKDGYVSIEVSPYLALDTDGSIAEARRLWKTIGRPNLMVKVPGTKAGAPAIQTLLTEGLNINVTLLFSLEAYQAVAEAYVAALEARVAKGEPIDKIASVASFFVSRIDGVIDKRIDERVEAGDKDADALKAIRGKVAIANAKLAYKWYEELIASDRWKALADKGAMPQRLLWASTGTKDPSYPDTLYVDTLIGPDTVNTMPPKTMDAFRDHGTVGATLTDGLDEAEHVMAEVDRLGLDMADVTSKLVDDGVKLFSDAADALLGAVAGKRRKLLGERLDGFDAKLTDALDEKVKARIEQARADGWSRRLWAHDKTLWKGEDDDKWLGWLAAAKGEQVPPKTVEDIAKAAKPYADAVLLGMGGSSLGPEVLSLILGSSADSPKLHVLDSTDPGQIATVAAAIDPADTIFIVSSKSGSTLEPDILHRYFFDLAEKAVGKGEAGKRFIAVTDPGSKLEKTAKEQGFLFTVHGDPEIGGRYSVLSAFGVVPAAVMGIDVPGFFKAMQPMLFSCGPDSPPNEHPGIRLGAVLGEAAVAGRDKLTILPSPTLAPFGAWLEQLIAESTGKEGRGIVPVDLEPLGATESYGEDRVFAHLHLKGDQEDAALHERLDALAAAGHPVIHIEIADKFNIGQEFLRWEIATAFAGAVIEIDPFNQPDVEDAKVGARKLTDAYEEKGSLEPETPVAETDDFALFAPEQADGDAAALLKAHFAALGPPHYAGFLAYIERDADHAALIAELRTAVRDKSKSATVAGFGPRFLHSTGQAYKGGPATGVFLVVTRDPEADVAIPGRKASFGTVQLAQARGDIDVLHQRGQRVLRVHLKKGGGGTAALKAAVLAAIGS